MPKDEEIRNINVRRKNIAYLIQRYLEDKGLYDTAETLKNEARLSEEFELCDNIDLDSIYLDYASYYQMKFGKMPKILRKVKEPIKAEVSIKRKTKPKKSSGGTDMEQQQSSAETQLTNHLQVTVRKIETNNSTESVEETQQSAAGLPEIEHGSAVEIADNALLNCVDWQQLADLVRTTILRDEYKLRWTHCYGNAEAVEIVKEAVLAPLQHPELFVNGLRPWKSVLLHGPPGSGKTMLAKILYAETRTKLTFFNVTSSIIVSKWRGESEKILRMLFHLAQQQSPAIIFFDEIEGLTSKRDRPSDHESSKRFKNELLQLLDGMEERSNASVFILASTNLPWDIDDAFLRRFEKKILVQLPNAVERAKLISSLLPATVSITKEKLEMLVAASEHFTGDEIRLACKEIAMQGVRRIYKCGGVEKTVTTDVVRLERAFEQIKPLSLKLLDKHKAWQQEHGS